MTMGTAKWFNAEKDFGFIRLEDCETDVAVHSIELEVARLVRLIEAQDVCFSIETDWDGHQFPANMALA